MNDSGFPPRAELASILRAELGGDGWQEELSAAIPPSVPPRALAGLDAAAAAALHKAYAAFYDDPLLFLVGGWGSGRGGGGARRCSHACVRRAAEPVGPLFRYRCCCCCCPPADQWIVGKGAQGASKVVAESFTARPFAGVPGLSQPAAPPHVEGSGGGAASPVLAPPAPAPAAQGPVIAWLRRAGLDSGPLLALGRRFEAAALVRPPMLDVSVRLPAVSLELTDAQVRRIPMGGLCLCL